MPHLMQGTPPFPTASGSPPVPMAARPAQTGSPCSCGSQTWSCRTQAPRRGRCPAARKAGLGQRGRILPPARQPWDREGKQPGTTCFLKVKETRRLQRKALNARHRVLLHRVAQHCTALHGAVQCVTVLHGIAQRCTAPHTTAWHHTALPRCGAERGPSRRGAERGAGGCCPLCLGGAWPQAPLPRPPTAPEARPVGAAEPVGAA